MSEIKIRDMRPDEIEIRVDEACENGVSLLLYRDATACMNILDETFGVFGWQRQHSRDNANCTISIRDPESGEWIVREDVGSAVPGKEYDKALASDAFKRAAASVGIGRELNTQPKVVVPANLCRITKDSNGAFGCRDRFEVKDLKIEQKRITVLSVVNRSLEGSPIVFAWEIGRGYIPIPPKKEEQPAAAPAKTPAAATPAPPSAAPSAAPAPTASGTGPSAEQIARAKNVVSPIRKHGGMTLGEVLEKDPNDAKGAFAWIAKSSNKKEAKDAAAILLSAFFAA